MIILVLDGEKFQIDDRFINLSELAKDLKENLGISEIPLEKDQISRKVLQNIIEYCHMNDFQPQKITLPINTNKLEKVTSQNDFKFIKEYEILSDELLHLYHAAQYLQIQPLLDLIYAKVCCEFYFGSKQSDYDNLLIKYKIKADITVEQTRQYLEQEPWLNEY